MVFWIAILVGAAFVGVAVRRGFYETWGLLFSSIISIYVAVFLGPSIAGVSSHTEVTSAYSTALGMIALAGGCFAILYGSSYVFLTAQFKVSFPEVFDILLAGGLGFLIGFLILSFIALVLTTTPLVENDIAKAVGLNPESQSPNIACVAWCCDLVHAITGSDTNESPTKMAIKRLLGTAHRSSPASDPLNETVTPSVPPPEPPAIPAEGGTG